MVDASDPTARQPDGSENDRVDVEPCAALCFACPHCHGTTLAKGLRHVLAVTQGARIETACSGCGQRVTLRREEEPRVVPATVAPVPNRQQRRAKAARGRKGPLIVT